jgi:hypothetical protein
MYLRLRLPRAVDFLEYERFLGLPAIWLRLEIVIRKMHVDRRNERFHTLEAVFTDDFVGELTEESFHEIEP